MAETPEACQFCETSPDVKYKCDDCNLFLCETCNNKLHTKVQSSIQHRVTEAKENEKDTENKSTQKVDLRKVQCLAHKGNACFAICQGCEKSICTSCLVKSNEHEKLDQIYTDKCERMKDYKMKIEEDLPFFTENLNMIRQQKAQREEKYNKVKQEIKNKEEKMKDEIAEQAVSLIKELDDWWSPQNDEILKEEERLNNAENDLKKRQNIIDEALQSDKAEDVMSAANQVIKDFPTKTAKNFQNQDPPRFATEKSTKNLTVGSLLKMPRIQVKSFPCDVTMRLAILNEDVTVGYDGTNKIMKYFVLTDNKCYYTKKYEKIVIDDITISKNGKTLVNRRDETRIYELNTDFSLRNFTDVCPFIPLCIHWSNRNNIVIGFKDNNFGTESRRGIMILNDQGTRIQTFEIDSDGKQLFKLPTFVTTNIKNGDICVIEKEEFDIQASRIRVLKEWGELKWTYEGHSSINKVPYMRFSPVSATTMSKGDILIADQGANQIHILSIDGNFITSTGNRVQVPRSLTTRQDDQILVGCSGKLYILEMLF